MIGDAPQRQDGRTISRQRRVKVTIACDQCRHRKVKCDGRRPVCAPCHQKHRDGNNSCTWRTSLGGRGVAKDRIVDMENRLAQLEKATVSSTSPGSSTLSASLNTPTNFNHITPIPESTNGTASHTLMSNDNLTGQPNMQKPYYGITGAEIDAVLCTSKQRASYGIANVGSLIASIQTSTNDQPDPKTSVQPFQTTLLQTQTNSKTETHTKLQTEPVNIELPSRAIVDTQFALYWNLFHPIFPVLDPVETESAYAELWTGQGLGSCSRPFICILNVLLALASRVNVQIPRSERENESQRYFARAEESYDFTKPDSVSFQSVQCLLLLGEYLHCIDPQQSWMYIGMAIRMAQSLGLHKPSTSVQIEAERSRELVRRVWYLCVMWDRILCSTYGRPVMIKHSDADAVPLPTTFEEDIFSVESPATELSASMQLSHPSAFFVKSIELYAVSVRALEDFLAIDIMDPSRDSRPHEGKHQNLGYDTSIPRLEQVLCHDRALAEWKNNLPTYLDASQVLKSDSFVARQAVILYQRYLQARLVMLRPLLSHLLKSRRQSPSSPPFSGFEDLSHQIIVQCATSCVSTAQEAIRTLQRYGAIEGEKQTNLSNTWWHNVLYLYSAVTALVAARMCPPVLNGVDQESVNSSWNLAMDIFQAYQDGRPWVQSIAKIVQALSWKAQEYLETEFQQVSSRHTPAQIEEDSAGLMQDWSTFDFDTFGTGSDFPDLASDDMLLSMYTNFDFSAIDFPIVPEIENAA